MIEALFCIHGDVVHIGLVLLLDKNKKRGILDIYPATRAFLSTNAYFC